MKNIWAPWRAEYILSKKKEGCVLCLAPKNDDSLLIFKGDLSFAMMNRFPYTAGHCMVSPLRHTGDYLSLTKSEINEIMILSQKIVSAIKKSMNPDGFNIGWNLGAIAGAGIDDHVHMHIVPRWKGDTNFMPVLSDIHMVSEHIEKTLIKIMEAFE